MRNAPQEEPLRAGKPARADHEEIGFRLFDQARDGVCADALDDARTVAQFAEIEPLNEPSKLTTRGLEFGLGFFMDPLGRDAGMGHHLSGDRGVAVDEGDIGIVQQADGMRFAGGMARCFGHVGGDEDLAPALTGLRVGHQDRAPCRAGHPLDRRADEHVAQKPATMRAHHDQVRVVRAGFLTDRVKGVASDYNDLCLGCRAKSGNLVRQGTLGIGDFLAYPVPEQFILDHMQYGQSRPARIGKLNRALNGGPGARRKIGGNEKGFEHGPAVPVISWHFESKALKKLRENPENHASQILHLHAIVIALIATLRDMLPIVLTIVVLHALVLGTVPKNPVGLALGLLAVLIGLTLLVRGLEMSLFPIREALADAMARHGHPVWLMGFAFARGFGSTVAAPQFPAFEAQRAALALQICYGVTFSLGLALMVRVWRILKGLPLIWLVLPGCGAIALAALLTDAPFVAVALDAGTAATSAINIPLMLALGIGLGAVLRSRNALVDGFGMVVLASLAPMLGFLATAFVLVPGG